MTDYASHLARVTSIVGRYSLLGPLPTEFTVYGEELERGAIVRAKMLRIDSRGTAEPEPGERHAIIGTTAKEVFLVGETDDEIHARFRLFALGLYEHEFYEWLRRDGELVDDPHAKG